MNPLGTLKKFKQKDRYGNSLEYEFNVPEMQDQIPLPYTDAIGNRTNLRAAEHPGEPKGLDTVPAWLTPGEAVIPQEAVEAEPQLVEDLINKGRSIQEQERGVPVPRLNSGSFVGSPEYFDSLMFKGKLSPAAIPQMSDEPSMGDLATQLFVNSATGEVEEKIIDPMVKGASSYLPSFFNDGGVAYANIGLVDFLKGAEDFRGEAYRDGDGWSIGYGSSGANEGDTITQEDALARLNKDLGWVNQSYDTSVTNKDLNMNQANAVKSLIYNIGAPNWEKSKAREALNAGDLEGFEREMRQFRMSGDEVLPGLEKRRNDEMALFNTSAASDVAVPIGKPDIDNKANFANQVKANMLASGGFEDPTEGYSNPPIPEGSIFTKGSNDSANQQLNFPEQQPWSPWNLFGGTAGAQTLPQSAVPPTGFNMEEHYADLADQLQDYDTWMPFDEVKSSGMDYGHGARDEKTLREIIEDQTPPEFKNYVEKKNKLLKSGSTLWDTNSEDKHSPFGSLDNLEQASGISRDDPKFLEKTKDWLMKQDLTTMGDLVDWGGLGDSSEAFKAIQEEYKSWNDLQKEKEEFKTDFAQDRKEKYFESKKEQVNEQIVEIDQQIKEANESGNTELSSFLQEKKSMLKEGLDNLETADAGTSLDESISGVINDKEPITANEALDKIFFGDQPDKTTDEQKEKDDKKDKEVEEAGKNADPTLVQSAMESFKNALGGMLDGDELARMALMYVGSRALGYDHGGSIDWAAKNYLKRVDSQRSARQKWIMSKDARATYELSSLKDYLRTGDTDLLEEKGVTLEPVSLTGKNLYQHTGDNKGSTLPIYKMNNDKEYVLLDGQFKHIGSTDVLNATMVHDKELHSVEGGLKRFKGTSESLYKMVNKVGDTVLKSGDEKFLNPSKMVTIANEANNIAHEESMQFGRDNDARRTIREQVDKAMADYFDAVRDYQNGEGKEPLSVRQFFETSKIENRTNGVISEVQLRGTKGENIKILNESVYDFAGRSSGNKQEAAINYQKTWERLDRIWDKYMTLKPEERKDFTDVKVDGWNDFTHWAKLLLEHDDDAMKVVHQMTNKNRS